MSVTDSEALIRDLEANPEAWSYAGRSGRNDTLRDGNDNTISLGRDMVTFQSLNKEHQDFRIPRKGHHERHGEKTLRYVATIKQWFAERKARALRGPSEPAARTLALKVGDQSIEVSATRVARVSNRLFRQLTPEQRSVRIERSIARLKAKGAHKNVMTQEAALLLSQGVNNL